MILIDFHNNQFFIYLFSKSAPSWCRPDVFLQSNKRQPGDLRHLVRRLDWKGTVSYLLIETRWKITKTKYFPNLSQLIFLHLDKLPSEGRWYVPTCVTPGVTAKGHSISISINQHQSASIRVNQHQKSKRIYQNQSPSIIINQRQ